MLALTAAGLQSTAAGCSMGAADDDDDVGNFRLDETCPRPVIRLNFCCLIDCIVAGCSPVYSHCCCSSGVGAGT
jgi:hypothetical protein